MTSNQNKNGLNGVSQNTTCRVKSGMLLVMADVELKEEFLRGQTLRWFGNADKMTNHKALVITIKITVRGKLKKWWLEDMRRGCDERGTKNRKVEARQQETSSSCQQGNTSCPLFQAKKD